jgi:intein/homing endonuclease
MHGLEAIEDIQVGEKVLSATEDGELVWGVVSRTYRVIQYEYYLINGAIKVTGTHPFEVGEHWVNVEELVVGDELSGMGGTPVLVETIEKIDFGVRAYNLEVDGTHTFFVDGVLVHNKEPDPGQG